MEFFTQKKNICAIIKYTKVMFCALSVLSGFSPKKSPFHLLANQEHYENEDCFLHEVMDRNM